MSGACIAVAPKIGRAVTPQGTIAPGSISVHLEPIGATNPNTDGPPTDLVSANDGTGRLFVSTLKGKIFTIDPAGTLSSTPFLNLNTSGITLYTDGEGGFPGLAFSPNFSAPANVPGSGKFYTFDTEPYSSSKPADYGSPELAPFPGKTTDPANQIVIREWSVNPSNPNAANTTSRVLLTINHPESNHQGGALKFGPDGDLYIGLGDGGGANDNNGTRNTPNDGHTDNLGNAQDTSVPFGKILRIDPNGNNSANGQYGIPSDNPFVGQSGKLPEIYAYGLRNAFRFSFDSATGKLYAGDVGQGNVEEVDTITKGGNYWSVFREGTRDNSGDYGIAAPAGFSSIDPIAEYSHNNADAIIGGFVYHGSALPQLDGKYIFGDLNAAANGKIFYMDAAGGTIQEMNYDLTGGGIAPPSPLYSFGEDASGELYALFANGQIVKLVPEPIGAPLLLLVSGLVARRRSGRA